MVQPSLNRLSRDGETVQIELRLMDLLVYLAGRRGEVASKAEIIDAVWQAEVVAENTLTHSIADLRRAFGDDARRPRFIETIPKRGYRIIAPVSGVEMPASDVAEGPLLKLVSSGREYVLKEGPNTIGRDEAADVRVGSERASRWHARITVNEGRAFIEDLDSRNGTFLQGERLETNTELSHGDEIHIGRRLAVLKFVVSDGRTMTEKAGEDS